MLLPGANVGFILLIAATSCLGSWPNFFRALPYGVRPELPLFNFTWTSLAVALVISLMFGTTGFDIPDFFDNMDGLSSYPLLIIYALLAGACLAIGNLLYLQGMHATGQTTAAPVVSGVSLLVGLTLIYSINAIKNRVDLLLYYLFPGLLFIAGAVACAIIAQIIKINHQRAYLLRQEFGGPSHDMSGASDMHLSADEIPMQTLNLSSGETSGTGNTSAQSSMANGSGLKNSVNLEAALQASEQVDLSFVPRKQDRLPENEETSNPASELLMRYLPGPRAQRSQIHALMICVLAGAVMGIWRVFANLALAPGYLTPYSSNFLFFCGATIGYFIAGPFLLYKPFTGRKGTIYDYSRTMDKAQHWQAIVSGFLFAFGICLVFISEQGTGYAVCFMFSNLAPLIVSVWGILFWKEFDDTPKKAKIWLGAMFGSYFVGLLIVMLSHISSLSLT